MALGRIEGIAAIRHVERQSVNTMAERKRPRSEIEQPIEVKESALTHPFRANFNDHFETSFKAIRDVSSVVNEYRQILKPSAPETFTIYDPYYCSGTVVDEWHRVGISKVIHENRDFYADIANGTVPQYDMLVTNPPFSDDHIQRLMDFLLSQKKPWCFLAPEYVASKEWYIRMIRDRCAISSSHGQRGTVQPAPFALPPFLSAAPVVEERTPTLQPEPYYLVPPERYDFKHPLGVGHDRSHFKSIWYISGGPHSALIKRGACIQLLNGSSASKPAAFVDSLDQLLQLQRRKSKSKTNR